MGANTGIQMVWRERRPVERNSIASFKLERL